MTQASKSEHYALVRTYPILTDNPEIDPIYGSFPRGQQTPVKIFESGANGPRCAVGSHSRGLRSRDFETYFEGRVEACFSCEHNLADLWTSLGYGRLATAELVGTRDTSVDAPVVEGTNRIDLSDFGVPEDARLWWMRITSGPSLDVINELVAKYGVDHETHQARFRVPEWLEVAYLDAPTPGEFPHVFNLLATQPPAGEAERSVAKIECKWVTTPDKPWPWQLLIDAMGSLLWYRDNSAVIWASTAVEAALYELLTERLRIAGISSTRVEQFLSDQATFGAQLNVVLPLVLSSAGLPAMADDLRGRLNRLRKLRNDLAHGTDVAVQEHVAELLKAAAFALHFLRYIGVRLDAIGL
jgi:hypothetical protein